MVLLVAGLITFSKRFPNTDVPVIQVTITQSGAAPSELQTQVTKRVEDALAGVWGVKHITSNITEGVSSTLIEFQLEAEIDRAVNDIKDADACIRADLPPSIDEPIVQRIDRISDPDICGEGAGNDARGAVMVCR